MAARTRAADSTSRAVLEMLAVVRHPLPLSDLAALTELSAERLDAVLAGLIAGRAVSEGEQASGPIYELAHPLIERHDLPADQRAARTGPAPADRAGLLESGRLRRSRAAFRPIARRATRKRWGSCSTRCARQNSARPSRGARPAVRADRYPAAAEPHWLDVLEAMSWHAEMVVDHRAESENRPGGPSPSGH